MDLPNSKRGAYDYFVMDYQQNVRMILTEENHTASNTCTMETSRAALEESIFGQAGANNEVAVTRYPTSQTSWSGNATAQVSQTGTWCGHNVGPNTLQKVMAGDVVNATVLYYHEGSAGGNSSNMVNTVLGSLLQAISGGNAASNLVKGNASNITNQLSGVGGFINAVQPNGSNPSGKEPQAFLTAIFFDERFNFIPAADGGVVQQQVDASVSSNGSSLTLANIKAPKNGYAFIYISNQSNKDVYFDNLQVGIVQGNIAEENHYYSYGLKIATLSSKKLGDSYEGTLKNNYLYNDKELFDDADLNWYDYGFRNYDPQIGRFTQLDPLTDDYPFLTPYQYASCDPINNIDVDGLEGAIITGTVTDVAKRLAFKTIKGVVGTAMKAGNAIVSVNRSRNVRNVSESLCQGCGTDKSLYAPSPPPEPETIRPGIPTEAEKEKMEAPENWREEMDEWENSVEASFLNKIYQENIAIVENSPTNVFPVISNLKKGGKYELMGYHKEARAAFGNAVKEAAIWYIGGKVIGVGFKYLAAAKGGGRIAAGSLKEFKSLVRQLSKPGSQLTKTELQQFEKLTEKFGGKLRYDLNPVKGKILQPHVQVEGLGTSVEGRKVWLGKGVK